MTGIFTVKTNIPGQEMQPEIELKQLVSKEKGKLINKVCDKVIKLFYNNDMFESDGLNPYSTQPIEGLVDAETDGRKSTLTLISRQNKKQRVMIIPEDNNKDNVASFIS